MGAVENSGNSGSLGEDSGIAQGVAKAEEEPGEAARHKVGRCHDNETHKEGEQNATQEDVGEFPRSSLNYWCFQVHPKDDSH